MNTHQIAAETESKLQGLLYSYSESHRNHNTAIIKAAIEKAYAKGWNESKICYGRATARSNPAQHT